MEELDKVVVVDFKEAGIDPNEYIFIVINGKSPKEKTIRLSLSDASLLACDLQFQVGKAKHFKR